MRPQSCKSKGRRLQQRVAASLREAFPHLTEDDVHSTPMGAHGEDVRLSTVAREAVPLSIECKCVEKLNVWACLEQCEANTPAGATPCLIFSRNRAGTYAVLPWADLVAMLHTIQNAGSRLPPRLGALLGELATYAPAAPPATPPAAPPTTLPAVLPNDVVVCQSTHPTGPCEST